MDLPKEKERKCEGTKERKNLNMIQHLRRDREFFLTGLHPSELHK